jgi:hypothetical protein
MLESRLAPIGQVQNRFCGGCGPKRHHCGRGEELPLTLPTTCASRKVIPSKRVCWMPFEGNSQTIYSFSTNATFMLTRYSLILLFSTTTLCS